MFGIRAVGEESEHALIAVSGESMQIEFLSIDRRRIDFEIAGVDDRAGRRLDRERKRIDDRMRHMEELDGEGDPA